MRRKKSQSKLAESHFYSKVLLSRRREPEKTAKREDFTSRGLLSNQRLLSD